MKAWRLCAIRILCCVERCSTCCIHIVIDTQSLPWHARLRKTKLLIFKTETVSDGVGSGRLARQSIGKQPTDSQ